MRGIQHERSTQVERLAAADQRTLLVDCDSQANATAAIGFAKDPARRTLYHALILNEPTDKIIQKSQVDSLDVVPADKNLAGVRGKPLNAAQRDRVSKIQGFLKDAREAAQAGDWQRARNLAKKAQVLSEDLLASI